MEKKLIEKLRAVVREFKDYHENADQVVEYREPDELRELVNLTLGDETKVSKLDELLAGLVRYSVKTGNKQYLNQLFSGFSENGFLGDAIAVMMNSSMYTYEVSPLGTLVERELIDKMNSYTGFENGDGIFSTGGSNSNLLAVLCARHKVDPNFKTKGLFESKPLSLFVSDQAHYSFEKAAFTLGIGLAYLYEVESDELGKVKPAALEEAIELSISKGERPFFVAATAGTTELGAFDPIVEMEQIARKYDCWFHVDGSWGGSIILSPDQRHFFKGLEKADSFAWNAHKLMNVPLICAIYLVNDPNILKSALSAQKSDYIFHPHDHAELDLGVKSLQCGRRNDAYKLWSAWKATGDAKYAGNINKLMAYAQKVSELIEQSDQLELMAPTQSLNINFRAIPPEGMQVDDFNLLLRNSLLKSGKSMVNYCHIGPDVSIRLVLVNHELEEEDLTHFISFVETRAREIKANG